MPSRSTNKLFHDKTLRKAIESFAFPDDIEAKHRKLGKWIETLNKGTLDKMKEVSLHGDFLHGVFQDILGYRSAIAAEGDVWEISAEETIADGGGSADGALGFFTATENKHGGVKLVGRVIAPIELKGATADLDRPAPGRKESPVDQGWRYANYTRDCKWVIVSNYRETRLYQTTRTPSYYESFRLLDMAELEVFKRFYFLLCRENFLPRQNKSGAKSTIDQLLVESGKVELDITEKLYQEYKQLRLDLSTHFQQMGADVPGGEVNLIEKAQKTLDRLLFIAFCEDKQLLPDKTIEKAHDYREAYSSSTIWQRYKSVFRWVDQGNDDPPIPGYNGGLFKHDPILDDRLDVPDELCTQMKELTRYDFDTEVSVDILGRIFEQSVTDLEELKAIATGQEFNPKKGKRKTQGVFYTPAFITQYIVGVALGGYLDRQEEALRDEFRLDKIPESYTRQRLKAEIDFWEAYRDRVLLKTRVVDPACGSGAFLIAAFDYLMRQYERVNEALAALKKGQYSVFDLNKTILNNNLYGVDLSPESVEITKLSLWLKTAERGKTLTYLDDNIKVGNSIIDDPQVDRNAFSWEQAFPKVFADGGFDVAIGNPPYVRQELLSPFKPYLQAHYQCYDGVADLYAYFYEKGVNLLKPGGVLSYIVTNKWFRAGYGEPLRRFFSQHSVFEQIIDFGHAPIFQDADTFPCIVELRKPTETPEPTKPEPQTPVLVCPVPREELENINLPQYVKQEGYAVPWSRFGTDAWSLEIPAVEELMHKIQSVGVPLKDFTGTKPYRGVLTGFNEAFLIDDATKNKLVREDPKSAEIIKPYLRGRDIKRWSPDWDSQWMIFARRGIDIDTYPAIKNHLLIYQEQLEPRPRDWNETEDGKWPGRKSGAYKWFEIQDTIDYFRYFERPKIIYQVIQTLPQYAYDDSGAYGNDKTFILPNTDSYLLGYLNSPLFWWYGNRIFTRMLSGSISPMGYLFETLPIAPPTDTIRQQTEPLVSQLIEITKQNQSAHRDILEWLASEHNIAKPGQKLEDFSSLEINEFVKEVKKRKPKADRSISPKALKELKAAYQDYAPHIQTRNAAALSLEHQLSDLVNQAYGLTPEEIDLMWKTAPPRMPIDRA
jgi:type I restriction-modification system DNA methylase subunit